MKLYAENFLSLSQIELDFDTWPQLTLLLGDNGSGKTAVFDLFLWTLTGQTSRGATHDDVISYGKNYVLGKVEIGDYTVVRTRKHPTFGTDLQIFVNGTSYKKTSIQETQKFIDSTLFNYREIVSTSYLSQHSLIFDLTDSDRKNILTCLLKLDSIQKVREIVRKDRDKVENELTQINALLDNLITEIKEEDFSARISEIKINLQTLSNELAGLEPLYVEYQSCLSKINRLLEIDICPTCLRPLSDEEKDTILSREEKRVEELEPKMNRMKEIKKEKDRLNSELMDLVRKEGAQSKQKEFLVKLEEFRDRKQILEKELEDLKIIEQAFSWKGALVLVLEQLSEILNKRISYFCQLVYPEVKIELLPYKVLKSGESRPVLEVNIKKGSSTVSYSNLSSGEKKRANLVLLFALAEIFNKTKVLFCDETFDHLDTKGVEGVVEVLSALGIPHIVVTSHSSMVGSLFPYVLQVKKINQITEIGGLT